MFMNQKKTHRPHRPKKPKAIREYTAGGVVYRPGEDGTVDILMIQDRAGRWTIPKGHVEEGERLEQTAVREVGEETGWQYQPEQSTSAIICHHPKSKYFVARD